MINVIFGVVGVIWIGLWFLLIMDWIWLIFGVDLYVVMLYYNVLNMGILIF